MLSEFQAGAASGLEKDKLWRTKRASRDAVRGWLDC